MKRDIPALIAFIEGRQNTPYKWGRKGNDCISFGAYAVKALTGHHWLRNLTWKDERSALRVLKKEGGVEAALDKRWERIPPSMAQRGDIAGVPDEHFGIHPMIVEGDTLVGPGDRGLKRAKRKAMITAWSATSPQPRKPKAD